MPLFDLPQDQLETYLPARDEPADFRAFWEATLTEARAYPLGVRLTPVDEGLRTVTAFDLRFRGFGGQEVCAWLVRPRGAESERLPCVLELLGYGGGRGFATDWLLYASAGYAHLVMDTRGQGSGWRHGDTPDEAPLVGAGAPSVPGFLTRGVLDPQTYYYRRVMTDAVRALEVACALEAVDPSRVAVAGTSQGGGLALALAGLAGMGLTGAGRAAALMADVPFLCHYRRAVTLTDSAPYSELATFCRAHRGRVAQVFKTLAFFDGVNFAAHAAAPALFSVALMDDVCPPSTVYAAYNHYAGPKEVRVWPFNRHEGGESAQARERLAFLRGLWG